ncbi:hypothetical protein FB639_003719, partial [Coemansia asiatica]
MSVKDNNDDDDEHYTRIQEMIDSLIKDADSALNSNPKRRLYHQQQQEQQQEQQEQEQKTLMHSDDSTDLQFTCDPLCSPEQLSSVSTVFDDAPSPSYPRPSSSRRLAANQSASSYRTPEICPRRPVSAMSMSYKSSRLRRYRPQTPVSKPRLLDTDPSEADAESDTELGSISASSSRLRNNYNIGHPHKRRQDASGNSSDLYAHSNYSTRPVFSSQQHQHQNQHQQHGHYLHSRYRSDTFDSFLSNSSETCVSPGNRYPRDFYRAPTTHAYSGAGSLVDSLCTPTRRGFNFDFNHMDHSDGEITPNVSLESPETATIEKRSKHEFPRLYNDQYTFQQQFKPSTDAHTSAFAGSNVPLIRRARNSFTQAMLQSDSFVDKSVSEDIAALASDPTWSSESLSSQVLCRRRRSNTVD